MPQHVLQSLDLAPAQHHPQPLQRRDDLTPYGPVLVIVFGMGGLVDVREHDRGRRAAREPQSRRDRERCPPDAPQTDGETDWKRRSVQLCHGYEYQEQKDDSCPVAGCDA